MSGLVGISGTNSNIVNYTSSGVVAFCTGNGIDTSQANPLSFSGQIGTSAVNHGGVREGDSGTVNLALGASFNIRSAIRSVTGKVKIFFEREQPDKFYGISAITEPNNVHQERVRLINIAAQTTTYFEFANMRVDGGTAIDPIMFSVVIFR